MTILHHQEDIGMNYLISDGLDGFQPQTVASYRLSSDSSVLFILHPVATAWVDLMRSRQNNTPKSPLAAMGMLMVQEILLKKHPCK